MTTHDFLVGYIINAKDQLSCPPAFDPITDRIDLASTFDTGVISAIRVGVRFHGFIPTLSHSTSSPLWPLWTHLESHSGWSPITYNVFVITFSKVPNIVEPQTRTWCVSGSIHHATPVTSCRWSIVVVSGVGGPGLASSGYCRTRMS